MLLAAGLMSMFFFLSLYLQQVLGASAMRTGFEYLPLALTIFLSAGAASAFVTKLGVRPVLIAGFVLSAIGLLWFSRVSADGSYLTDVLFPSLIVAVGLGWAFVSVTLAATAGTDPREAGLASGLLNTSQQVGGALGLAILATLATDKTNDVMAAAGGAANALPGAMTEGFRLAFLVGACLSILGAVVTAVWVRPPREAVEEAETVPIAA
jgi:MFS family permease